MCMHFGIRDNTKLFATSSLQMERITLLNDIKEINEHVRINHTNELDQISLNIVIESYYYDTNGIIMLSIKFCCRKLIFFVIVLI